MKNLIFLLLLFVSVDLSASGFESLGDGTARPDSCRDLYSDTWVATDALGRTMPLQESVGPLKNDQRRVVGMFYITWHTQDKAKGDGTYEADVTKILSASPEARFDPGHPAWQRDKYKIYHWGEPEMGYFLSQDEWMIRKDMSMLSDVGVDVIIMDVTNAVRYWDEWEVIFRTMQRMKAEGNKVPEFCFWAFNGPVITVVQDLYDRIYKQGRYKDLWFHWDGKPLLLYNATPFTDATGRKHKHKNPHFEPAAASDPSHPHYGDPDYANEFYTDYTKEVKSFFTLRNMWWGYYKWAGQRFVGMEDNWSFGYNLGDPQVSEMTPQQLVSKHGGKPEQAAVTAAQHPVGMGRMAPSGIGKSWSRKYGEPSLNEYDMPGPAYVPWLGKTVENPENYGIYFQERFDEMLPVDPEFLYLNDWNEWTAIKFDKKMKWLGRENDFYFVDQYNAEFNRCIQPAKGSYGDNYYMQMAQNIRRYKGVRSIPENSGFVTIDPAAGFGQWDRVPVEYRDTRGDTFHRDAPGYGGIRYIDRSGRNDILTCKAAVDEHDIAFYAETAAALTDHVGKNWMLLLIDADQNSKTGWYGYDFIVNRRVINARSTTLMRYDEKRKRWKEVAEVTLQYAGNRMMVSVPRRLLGIDKKDSIVLDFKWSDHADNLNEFSSLYLKGDTAPNRRFNYRFIWRR